MVKEETVQSRPGAVIPCASALVFWWSKIKQEDDLSASRWYEYLCSYGIEGLIENGK